MQWKVEVSYKPDVFDAIGEGINQDIADLGIEGVERVRSLHLYWIEGELTECEINEICRSLLADTITQKYCFYNVIQHSDESELGEDDWVVEVTYKPGVTDAVGDSVVKGIRDMGIDGVKSAKTGQKFVITGSINREQLERISKQLLANEVIQNFTTQKQTSARYLNS